MFNEGAPPLIIYYEHRPEVRRSLTERCHGDIATFMTEISFLIPVLH